MSLLNSDVSPDYEPLSPAMSSPGPSISERGINSPSRSVVSDHLPVSFPAPTAVTATISRRPQVVQLQQKPQPVQQQIQQPPKTVIFSSPTITTTNTKPRYVVEKIPAQMLTNNVQNVQIRTNQQPKKEVKIYKMTPASANTMNGSGPKKVTIQMKDAQGKVSQHPVGTYVINKNNGSISGKIISTELKITLI